MCLYYIYLSFIRPTHSGWWKQLYACNTPIATLISDQREMESALSLKMLAVLALVLLVSGVNEGKILSKCELKVQLDAALGANIPGNMNGGVLGNTTGNVTGGMQGNMTGNLIATLVCGVERISRFDTNLISTIRLPTPPPQNPPKPNGPHPEKPHSKPEGRPDEPNGGLQGGKPGQSSMGGQGGRPGQSSMGGQGGRPDEPNGGLQGGKPGQSSMGGQGVKPGQSSMGGQGGRPRGKRSPSRGPEGGRHRFPPSSVGSPVSSGMSTNLYGIFQLSDRVACDSGSNQSLNICRMSCSALIDDDISDDIACLKTLMEGANNVMNVQECLSIVPSQYFALCA